MMDIDFNNLRLEERQPLFEAIGKTRFAVARPESLKRLTIKSIGLNYCKFLNLVSNPFNMLSNPALQDILEMIKELRYSSDRLIPMEREVAFVLLLLNHNMTEFDPQEFNEYSCSKFDAYYKHLQENCPNLTKIIGCSIRDYTLRDEIPLEEVFKWKSLKHISFTSYLCKDETAKRLLEYFPNIESLEFAISKESFSMEGVKYLSQMQKLKQLGISLRDDLDTEIVVACAGQIPNLQNFNCRGKFETTKKIREFFKQFQRLYPSKKLNMESLNRVPETEWPQNLHVEKLRLQGKLSSKAVKIISTIPLPPKEIDFDAVPYNQVYQITEKIGTHLTKVHFFDDPAEGSRQSQFGKCNLARVIKSCPNLEVLYFSSGIEEGATKLKLTPQSFKNWKEFDISDDSVRAPDPEDDDDDNDDDYEYTEVDKLFKLFLLGTENYNRTLRLKSFGQIKILAEVLNENPTCLNTLEKLHIDIYKDGILPLAVEAAKCMIFRSPYLKKIKFHTFIFDPFYIPRELRRHHRWFSQLVEGVGVRFKIVDETELGNDDSSFADLTEFEDSDEEDEDEAISNRNIHRLMSALSAGIEDDEDDDSGEAQIQCPVH